MLLTFDLQCKKYRRHSEQFNHSLVVCSYTNTSSLPAQSTLYTVPAHHHIHTRYVWQDRCNL